MSKNKRLDSRWLFLSIFVLGSMIYSSLAIPILWQEAYAHSLPVTESPSPDSIIKKGEPLPSKIVIDFSERPEPTVSSIAVLNGKNERVDNGNFVIIGDHSREAMTNLDTKKLTDGVYTVSWMTQSADDGHIARGSYVFGVGNVGPNAVTSIKGMNQTTQVQAVTSNLDGLIKWPLLISQATIVGGIFSHLFLWERFGNRIRAKLNGPNLSPSYSKNIQIPIFRRFSTILVMVSLVVIASSTGLLFLQITELSAANNISGYGGIFNSLLHGPSGLAWLVRCLTSISVIIIAIISYYSLKNNRLSKTNDYHQHHLRNELESEPEKRKKFLFSTSFLLQLALIAGSISIFANSATSHNAGVNFVPSLAIFLDWLHFMAVSVWVGGLFYISTILLWAIKHRAKVVVSEYGNIEATGTPNTSFANKAKSSIIHYYLALLLPRFSLLATASLGIIGISGLYMAWIHLNSASALFSTAYGNVLIIKLAAALPLVLLGGYHQLKLHGAVVSVASLAKIRPASTSQGNNSNLQVAQNFNNNKNSNNIDNFEFPVRETKKKKIAKLDPNSGDISTKFSKTIKIESLIAITVLLVASLLTITSPSPMNGGSMNMSMNMAPSSTSMSNGGMNGMSMSNTKNASYIKEVKILGVNTKIEINPFNSGFNTFKITFNDANGKPYSKISTVRMIFKNDQADIGPITTNLKPISPGVYSITGGYISQPGEWNIALAAQRLSDYDLNYRLTAMVKQPNISASLGTSSSSSNNNIQERAPVFDSFAILTVALAGVVGLGSAYFYTKSKKELSKTIQLLGAELDSWKDKK